MALGGLLCLGMEVGGSGSTGEIPGKDWLEEGMEDELCAAKWFDRYELEGVDVQRGRVDIYTYV